MGKHDFYEYFGLFLLIYNAELLTKFFLLVIKCSPLQLSKQTLHEPCIENTNIDV